MDFSQVRFNPSRLGYVMADAKGIMSDTMRLELSRLKIKETLTQIQEWRMADLQYRLDTYDPKKVSGGCEGYLIGLYSFLKYGRRPEFKGDAPIQLIKGLRSEVRATEMVARVTAQNLFRYKKRFTDEYLSGQLDVLDAKDFHESKVIIEIKNSAGLHGFIRSSKEPLPRKYFWQMQGYFALIGKENGIVYNCLVDYPDHIIKEQHDLLFAELCPDGIMTDFFEEEWNEKEKGFRFSDIPEEERIIPFPVERDEKSIERIYEKIDICREWMAEFEKIHSKKTYGIVIKAGEIHT